MSDLVSNPLQSSRMQARWLWPLDLAFLILSLTVLALTLRFLRFDDPDIGRNAWTFLIGVPLFTVLSSMLLRSLGGNSIERSVQVGFLMSVLFHLGLSLLAIKVIVFSGNWQNVQLAPSQAARASRTASAQFYQATKSAGASRPDYLKPVETKEQSAVEVLDPSPQRDESAKLDGNIQPELEIEMIDTPFEIPRAEPSPSQPTIASTAERLGRPERMQEIEPSKSSIDIPKLNDRSTLPSQATQAIDVNTARTNRFTEANPIAPPPTTAPMESAASKIVQSLGQRNDPSPTPASRSRISERQTDQSLENALAQDRSENRKPTPKRNGFEPNSVTSPIQSASMVPIPQMPRAGVTSDAQRSSESQVGVDRRLQKSENGSKQLLSSGGGGTARDVDAGASNSVARLAREGSVGSAASGTKQVGSADGASTPAFLNDSRFSGSGLSKARNGLDSMGSAAPGLNGQIEFGSLATGGLAPGVSSELDGGSVAGTDVGRGDGKRGAAGPSGSTLSSSGGSGIASNALGPIGGDSFVAPLIDVPRKGINSTRFDIEMPEIKAVDFTTDRFRRPDVGGPPLAKSKVPIPAPAFNQRLQRNLEDRKEASDLGPLGPQTEEAIERGLQFLARHQREDGSWHLEDFDEKVEIQSDSAATALALLSFQGAGYTHQQFKYAEVCRKALRWLTTNQRPNGDLYIPTDSKSNSNAWLYSHGIASLALCEAYGMTQDESIKENAQRAVDFMIDSQDPNGGGWRYTPREGSDTSVTGWCMMALKSAELAGLQTSPTTYRGITKWLNGSQASEQQKFLYRYNWQAADAPATRHGRVPTPVMTSVGLLMRLYLGWKRDNPDMLRGSDWLLARPPAEGTVQSPQRDTYYWYYASQVMFHMGGNRWKTWYANLYPMLIRTQQTEGKFAGSWEPNGEIPDAWGKFGGRLYVTTLNLLSLEVYYRHLPIYEATAK